MLIAWQALNKLANPYDKRFSDRFLIVTPGHHHPRPPPGPAPQRPGNYYRAMDLVTPEQLDRLQAATIEITNYHALIRREKIEAASADQEDPGRRRRATTSASRRRRPRWSAASAASSARQEHRRPQRRGPPLLHAGARRRRPRRAPSTPTSAPRPRRTTEEARVWFDGLQAVRDKIGVRAVFDLSATPFFLKGSGYAEGTLFPWVVSRLRADGRHRVRDRQDPARARSSDDSMAGDLPDATATSGSSVRDALPRKGLKDTTAVDGDPILPKELEGALQSLYARLRALVRRVGGRRHGHARPCSSSSARTRSVSKLVYDWIAG